MTAALRTPLGKDARNSNGGAAKVMVFFEVPRRSGFAPTSNTGFTITMETPPPVTPQSVPPLPKLVAPSSENSFAVIMHLLGLAGLLMPFPGSNIIGPLVLWLLKRHESPLLERVGKEVINFQITYAIAFAVGAGLCLVLVGFLVLPLLFVAWLIFMILGAVKASNGEDFRYPVILRLLK
jgi:uncharacterized Tic20 family protein